MKNIVVQAIKAGLFFSGLLIIYNTGREEGIKEGLKHGMNLGQAKAGLDFANIMLKTEVEKNEERLVN